MKLLTDGHNGYKTLWQNALERERVLIEENAGLRARAKRLEEDLAYARRKLRRSDRDLTFALTRKGAGGL